jgi:hypothetical protein
MRPAPWRNSTSKFSAEEISLITERLGVDEGEIVERLRRLGYDASPVIDTILATVASVKGVKASQVLRAAKELGFDVADVVDRYNDLGFDTANAVGSLDLVTLEGGDGKQLWEAKRGRIGRAWISRAADRLQISSEEITRRLRAEGFVVLDANAIGE